MDWRVRVCVMGVLLLAAAPALSTVAVPATLTASPASPATLGTLVTFTYSQNAGRVLQSQRTVQAGVAPVTFKDGATTLGTVPLSAGTASLSTAALSVGTHLISASDGLSTATLSYSIVSGGQSQSPFPLYNLNVAPLQASASGPAGGTVQYVLNLTNLGQVVDTYNLSLSSGLPGSANPSIVSLAPGASSPVDVTLTIPSNLSPGYNVTQNLTAASSGQAGLQVSRPLTTTVSGPVQATFNVTLQPGWNPLALQTSDVLSVQPNSNILGFQVPGGSPSAVTQPALLAAGIPTKAGWIYAQGATNLTYTGDVTPSIQVPLQGGWNLVGFPGSAPILVSALRVLRNGSSVPLSTVVTGLQEVQSDLSYRTLDPTQASTQVVPGRAYWVQAAAAVTLSYP